jgi:hypothetical protein
MYFTFGKWIFGFKTGAGNMIRGSSLVTCLAFTFLTRPFEHIAVDTL